jgi:IPT/TIG domain-containing protein
VITSFTPTSGPVGTSVTLTGTGFTGVSGVSFNGTAATTFTVSSDTQMSATVPAGATTGKISVTNTAGTGTSATSYTVTFSISGTISPASSGSGAAVTLSGGPPVLARSAHGSSSTGHSSGTVSFGAASAAGDTIVLFLRFGGATISGVTDNQNGGSNTYTSVMGPTQWGVAPNPTDRWAQVFVAKRITGGSRLTITVNLSGNSTHDIYMAALEYSGVDPVNPVNATALGSGTVNVNGAPATGNLTTGTANAKLVATSWDSNESYTSTGNGSGYTTDTAAAINSISGGSGWANLTEQRTATNAGTWTATASSSPAVNDWVIQLVALAPAPIQSVTPQTNGNYTFSNLKNGNYSVTPTELGFRFTPASRAVTVNGANVTGINFIAQ